MLLLILMLFRNGAEHNDGMLTRGALSLKRIFDETLVQ